MTLHQMIIVVVFFSVIHTSQEYATQEYVKENKNHDESHIEGDINDHFGGFGAKKSSLGRVENGKSTQGSLAFVRPSNLTYILPGGHYGTNKLLGSSQQLFQSPRNGFLSSTGDIPLTKKQTSGNRTEFKDNHVSSRSLFNASSSPNENGFRPHGFLHGTQIGKRSHGFSPGIFDSLKKDVDKEVDYHKREEEAIERVRNADERQFSGEEDEEQDSYESSEFDFDDSSESNPFDHGSNEFFKDSYENDDSRERFEYPEQIDYESPSYNPSFRSQSQKSRDHASNEDSGSEENDNSSEERHENPSKSKQTSHYNRNRYQYPNTNQPIGPVVNYHPMVYHRPISPLPHYSQTRAYLPPVPASSPVTRYSVNNMFLPARRTNVGYNTKNFNHNPPQTFKPSPRDIYLDSIHNPARGKTPSPYPTPAPTKQDRSLFVPKPDYGVEVPQKTKPQIESKSKKKKFCKKAQKKIDTGGEDRFKPQKMTCFICTNGEKGNTYEECTYESNYQLPESSFKRERRSVENSFGKILTLTTSYKPLIRKVRQHDYAFDSFELEDEHDDENHSSQNERNRGIFSDEFDKDDSEEGAEEETDIEKEYQPPGASKSDDCHEVEKRGMTCLVCKNSKTGGSYEQCSYTSDPHSNRYKYSSQSSYGSKRKPNSDRFKRHRVEDGNTASTEHHRQKNKFPARRLQDGFQNQNLRKDISKIQNERTKKSGEPKDPVNYNYRTKKIKTKIEGHKNDEDVSTISTEYDSKEIDRRHDDSFFKLFPELADSSQSLQSDEKDFDYSQDPGISDEENVKGEDEESSKSSKHVKPSFRYETERSNLYFDESRTEKDLEKTLNEFNGKNRSDCKKIIKDKMTCYQCVDKKGMQNEECIFVAARNPKHKHLTNNNSKNVQNTANESIQGINSTPASIRSRNVIEVIPTTMITKRPEIKTPPKSKREHNKFGLHENKYPNNKNLDVSNPHQTGYVTFINHKSPPKLKYIVKRPQNSMIKTKRADENYGNSSPLLNVPLTLSNEDEVVPEIGFEILKTNPKIKTVNNINI